MLGFSAWTVDAQFLADFCAVGIQGNDTCWIALSFCTGRTSVVAFGELCRSLWIWERAPQGQAQLLRKVAWEQIMCLRERWSFAPAMVHVTGTRPGVWVWSPVSCLVRLLHVYIQPARPPATLPPWEQGSQCRKNQRLSPCCYRVKGPLSMRMPFCLQSGIESSPWFWSFCL